MNKHIFKLFLFIFCMFIFYSNVNAECSYQERKELLNSANNIKIGINSVNQDKELVGINPETGKEETKIIKDYYFVLSLSNIPDNIFVTISSVEENVEFTIDKNNTENGLYLYEIDNVTDIFTYNLSFYSLKEKCYAEKITTKKVKKPKLNPIYYYSICQNEEVNSHKYCQQFIDSDFAQSEESIINSLKKIIDEKSEKQNNNKNKFNYIIKKYWYIPTIIIVLIILITSLVIINEKSVELS